VTRVRVGNVSGKGGLESGQFRVSTSSRRVSWTPLNTSAGSLNNVQLTQSVANQAGPQYDETFQKVAQRS